MGIQFLRERSAPFEWFQKHLTCFIISIFIWMIEIIIIICKFWTTKHGTSTKIVSGLLFDFFYLLFKFCLLFFNEFKEKALNFYVPLWFKTIFSIFSAILGIIIRLLTIILRLICIWCSLFYHILLPMILVSFR